MLSSKKINKIIFLVFLFIVCLSSHSWAQTIGTITGSVYEETSHTPISQVLVICYDYYSDEYASYSVSTLDNGTYSINVPVGDYRVMVNVDMNDTPSPLIPEYYNNKNHAHYADKVSVTESHPTVNNIDFALSIGGVISGMIYDQALKPLEDAKVQAYKNNTTRDFMGYAHSLENGRYFLHLPEGDYIILASSDHGDYVKVFYPDTTWFDYANVIHVDDNALHDNYNFSLMSGIRVNGTVSNQNDHFIQITVLGGDGYWTIAEEGQFSVVVPPGQYIFHMVDPNGQFMRQYFNNVYDEIFATPVNVFQNMEIPLIDFDLVRPGWISGSVRTNVEDSSVQNIQVVAFDSNTGIIIRYVYTNVNGDYVLELPPGQYKIVVDDYQKNFVFQYFNQTIQLNKAETLTVYESQAILSVDFYLVHMKDLIVMLQCLTNQSFQTQHMKPMDANQNNRIDMKDVITIFQLLSE